MRRVFYTKLAFAATFCSNQIFHTGSDISDATKTFTTDKDNLFRDIPGFRGNEQNFFSSDNTIPVNIPQLAKMAEYSIVGFCSILGFWLLYWVGKTYLTRQKKKKEVKNIVNIN